MIQRTCFFIVSVLFFAAVATADDAKAPPKGQRVFYTGHSFHSRKPVARLDRIFASPELEAVDAGVHQSALAARASDHLPIWARFKPAD